MAPPRVVLHVDADAFFCQVTRLSIDGSLLHRSGTAAAATDPGNANAANDNATTPPPLAVQQEGGIIAADHAARALGVTKHSDARVAEQILRPHGGRVVSVYSEPAPPGAGGGGRVVSYRPYREMSAAMVRVLKEAAGPGVVLERASIDEAFLEPATVAADGDEENDDDEQQQQQRALERGRELADALRAAAREKLGLVLSVGVARNKLLAKLASRAAKPDGVFVVEGGDGERASLEATPVEKLPGQGGAVARALRRLGARTTTSPRASSPSSPPRLATAADVARRFGGDPSALAAATGLDLPTASRLTSYAQGNDGGSPVVDRGPPRSLGAQHTLTPITVLSKMLPLAMRRETCPRGDVRTLLPPLPARGSDAFRKAEAEEEERGRRREQQQGWQQKNDDDPPWLGPRVGGYTLLRHGAPGAALRLRRVLEALCRDLLGRVLLDSRDEGGRWPRKLRVSVGAMDPGLTAAGAPGGNNNNKQQQQQQQKGGGAPVWGPCMGHASRSGDFPPRRLAAAAAVVGGGGGGGAAAAPAAPSSPERSLSVPAALLDATTTAAVALVDGLMNSRAHHGCPIIALSVTATNFEGGAGGGGGGGGNGGKQQKKQQQEIGRYFARDEAAAAAAVAVGSKRSRGGETEASSGEEEGSSEEEEEDDALPLASSSPSPSPPPPVAAPRPPPPPQQHHHQPITLLRLPLVKPIVLHDPRALPLPENRQGESAVGSPPASDHDTAVVARAMAAPHQNPPPARKALFFAAPPPPPPPAAAPIGIRLTAVLNALAGGDDDDSGDDEEAERALEGALRAAKARRVLRSGGGGG